MIEVLIGWGVILGALAVYTERTRHPDRAPVRAYLTFLAVFGGGCLAVLIPVVLLGLTLERNGHATDGLYKAIAPIVTLGLVVPLWFYAGRRISTPPY